MPAETKAPTWFMLLVRELMEAGSDLAALLQEPPATEHEGPAALQRWERVVRAMGVAL